MPSRNDGMMEDMIASIPIYCLRKGLCLLLGFMLLATGMAADKTESHAAPCRVEVSRIKTPEPWAWSAKVVFQDSHKPPVVLFNDPKGPPWEPNFEVSPDGHWILYIQKTGSGQNVAWLYSVDDQGHVTKMKEPFDAQAWRFSDQFSPFKFAKLYHTGVEFIKWLPEKSLRFSLEGTSLEKKGEGVSLILDYDLVHHKFTEAP